MKYATTESPLSSFRVMDNCFWCIGLSYVLRRVIGYDLVKTGGVVLQGVRNNAREKDVKR